MKPRVSVVIPVFNGSQTVGQSIGSVLEQTWPNLEVIVVDDGSKDDSIAVIQRFISRGVQLIPQPNGGAARARNIGFSASSGDFVQFLDSDDLLDPRKIEVQMQRLEQEGRDCVACGVWESFECQAGDGKRASQPSWCDAPAVDWLMKARGGGGKMPTGSWLTPRSIIERAGPWDESLPGNPDDDGEFFSRVVLASRKVLFCGDSVYYYRSAMGGLNLRQATRSDCAAHSLLVTQRIYEQRLIGVENSLRARQVAAHGYASFLEQVYPEFPDYCAEAVASIKRLNVPRYPPPGGKKFALIVRHLGLIRTLSARERLRKLLGRPLMSRFSFH